MGPKLHSKVERDGQSRLGLRPAFSKQGLSAIQASRPSANRRNNLDDASSAVALAGETTSQGLSNRGRVLPVASEGDVRHGQPTLHELKEQFHPRDKTSRSLKRPERV